MKKINYRKLYESHYSILIPRIYICHLLEWYLLQDKSFSAKALGYYLQVKFKKINTSKTLEIECKKYLRNQKWNQGMSAYTNGYQAV